MINLVDIIPASWRKPIYAVYAIVGVILGAMQIALDPDPNWLMTTMAIYAFIGGAVGAVANANTHPVGTASDESESEDYESF